MRRRRPWWRLQLSSYLTAMLLGFLSPTIWLKKAPYNDLSAFKSAFHIKDQYQKLGHALLASMQSHSWYLSEQLVLLSLSDDDSWSPICGIGFSPLEFMSSSESGSLSCLLFTCQQSWVSLLVHRVGYFWKWLKSLRGRFKSGYMDFVRKIACVNDCA